MFEDTHPDTDHRVLHKYLFGLPYHLLVLRRWSEVVEEIHEESRRQVEYCSSRLDSWREWYQRGRVKAQLDHRQKLEEEKESRFKGQIQGSSGLINLESAYWKILFWVKDRGKQIETHQLEQRLVLDGCTRSVKRIDQKGWYTERMDGRREWRVSERKRLTGVKTCLSHFLTRSDGMSYLWIG